MVIVLVGLGEESFWLSFIFPNGLVGFINSTRLLGLGRICWLKVVSL